MKKFQINRGSETLEKGVSSFEPIEKKKLVAEGTLIPVMSSQGVFVYVKDGKLQIEYKNLNSKSKGDYSFFLFSFAYRNGLKYSVS